MSHKNYVLVKKIKCILKLTQTMTTPYYLHCSKSNKEICLS